MPYPASYKYTKEHEWISVDGALGTVGITDYAQSSLGDIVFVELPKVREQQADPVAHHCQLKIVRRERLRPPKRFVQLVGGLRQ